MVGRRFSEEKLVASSGSMFHCSKTLRCERAEDLISLEVDMEIMVKISPRGERLDLPRLDLSWCWNLGDGGCILDRVH